MPIRLSQRDACLAPVVFAMDRAFNLRDDNAGAIEERLTRCVLTYGFLDLRHSIYAD
jgi:hypothetical protein